MKNKFFLVTVFFLACLPVFRAEAQEASEINSLTGLDAEVRKLGLNASTWLETLPAGSQIKVGNFSFMGSSSLLGSYWQNQLLSVLVEKSGSVYTLMEPGSILRAGLSISGEIQRLGTVTRIYTRVTDITTSRILNVWHSDLRLTGQLEGILTIAALPGSNAIMPDIHETDSMEAPVSCELGSSSVFRTIHQGSDSDWFIVISPQSTTLTAETSGDLDTKMTLYNADDRTELEEDDDSGTDTNASITWNAEEGRSYLIKVNGYDRGETGPYGFRVMPANNDYR